MYGETMDETSKTFMLTLLLEFGDVLFADAASRLEHTLSSLQAIDHAPIVLQLHAALISYRHRPFCCAHPQACFSKFIYSVC